MILEIRHYTLKSGQREAFISFFESENRKALIQAGMLVFGPLRDLEDTDKVHWMRAFNSMEERDRLKTDFYDGPVWHEEIEPIAMAMIEHFQFELVETTARFENFDGRGEL